MCHPAWGRALAAAHRQRDLERLRSAGDRIDGEPAGPPDTDALARVTENIGRSSRPPAPARVHPSSRPLVEETLRA